MPHLSPPTHPFPKTRRIRKRPEFLRIQNDARRVTCEHFVLLVAVQPDRQPDSGGAASPRLGLVVTKKVGSAVARNRIKRVCRECFRTWPNLLPPGVDLLVIAKNGADELGLADVRREWGSVERSLAEAARKAMAKAQKKTHVSGRP